MTVQAFLRVLWKHWIVVLITTLVATAAAWGVTRVMPRVYVATTTQFVRGITGATGSGAEYQAAQFAQSRAKSYSVMIGNPDVLSGIISDLQLEMSPGDLYSRLSVDNPIDTALINVTARGRTADEAQDLSIAAANNLAKLIIRLESAGTASGRSPIDIQTVVPALKPTQPASPRLILNLAVGSMLGLALGSIIALALDARPSRPGPGERRGQADDRSQRGPRRTRPILPRPESPTRSEDDDDPGAG